MENQKICQSCAMPLQYDPNKGGTNSDLTISDKYCSYCYKNGKFVDEGISLKEKIESNVRIAVSKMNMTEVDARKLAESILPQLERWK